MRTASERTALRNAVLGTPAKRAALNERAAAWKADFDAAKAHEWQRKDGSTVKVDGFAGSGERVHFFVTVTDADGNVIHENDHCIVNPPLLHPDGGADENGKPTFAPNVAAIVRKIVEDHLP